MSKEYVENEEQTTEFIRFFGPKPRLILGEAIQFETFCESFKLFTKA